MDEVEVRTAPKQGERLTEAEVAETGSVSYFTQILTFSVSTSSFYNFFTF